jgi:hypothetical protein
MAAHRSSRPARSAGVTLPLTLTLALALGLSACGGGGPGTEEELVTALTREDTFTQDEAECIASAVFDEYSADEEAIGRISAASDFDNLSGPDGVEGFAEFYDDTISACAGG